MYRKGIGCRLPFSTLHGLAPLKVTIIAAERPNRKRVGMVEMFFFVRIL